MATRPTRPNRSARSDGTVGPAAPAPTTPTTPKAPSGPTAPAGRPPLALRLAAGAQLVEAVGLCVAGVFSAVSTADGQSYQLASGIALTLIAFGTAAGLAAIAAGLAKARPWSRIPGAMTQLFVLIAGFTLLEGRRPEWGVPALVLGFTVLGGLLAPASLRTLNRPRQ